VGIARRIYRPSLFKRRFSLIVLIVAPMWGWLSRGGDAMLAVVLFAFGTWFVGLAYRSRIILSENAIEERTVFRTRTLPFDQIRGCREYYTYGRYGAHIKWELVPNSRDLPTLRFGKGFEFDDGFYEWLNKLPSLNESRDIERG